MDSGIGELVFRSGGEVLVSQISESFDLMILEILATAGVTLNREDFVVADIVSWGVLDVTGVFLESPDGFSPAWLVIEEVVPDAFWFGFG